MLLLRYDKYLYLFPLLPMRIGLLSHGSVSQRFARIGLPIVMIASSVLPTFSFADSPPPGPIPPSCELAHWKFDEGQGGVAADATGNGHNFIFTGNVGWTTGLDGSSHAVRFTGGSGGYLTANLSNDFNFGTNPFTASYIVKGTQFGPQSVLMKDRYFGSGGYTGLYTYVHGNSLAYWNGNANIFGGTAMDNVARRFTFVREGTGPNQLKVYVDNGSGTVLAAVGQEARNLMNSFPLTLGASADAMYPLTATIDNARVFSCALSASQVASLSAPVNTPPPAPRACGTQSSDILGYWPMNEGNGNITKDMSGNNHTARLRGNIQWTDGYPPDYSLWFSDGGADGTYIDIDDTDETDPSFNLGTSDFTLAYSAARGGSAGEMIVGKSSYFGPYTGLYTYQGQNMRYWNGTNDISAGPTSPTLEPYTKYVFVRKNGVMKAFRDGVLVATGTDGRNLMNNLPLRFGAPADATGHRFSGVLDDVRIYKCAVDDNNIQSLPLPYEMDITMRSWPQSDDVVKNQKNVSLLSFLGKGVSRNVVLTSLQFRAAIGNLASLQNYKLWADTNGDYTVDTIIDTAVPENGTLTFDSLLGGGRLLTTTATHMEVHGDVGASIVGPSFQLAFADAEPNFVRGEDTSKADLVGIRLNGTNLSSTPNPKISVATVPAVLLNIFNQGDLFVYSIPSTNVPYLVQGNQCLGGTLCTESMSIVLKAKKEAIDVTRLVLTWNVPSYNLMTNIERIELYRLGATTPFAIATVAGCGTQSPRDSVCADIRHQELVVPKNKEEIIIGRIRMNNDVRGGVPGVDMTYRIAKETVPYASVEARGAASSNTLQNNNGNTVAEGEIFIGSDKVVPVNSDIVGVHTESVLSKITAITNADPTPDGTAIPVGTQKTIGQFKFTAAPNDNTQNGPNKVKLTDIYFTVEAKNVRLSPTDFRVYSKDDPLVKSPCSLLAGTASAALLVKCEAIPTASSVNTTINPGEEKTFILEANVQSAQVDPSLPSSLMVSFNNFNDYRNTTLAPFGGSHLRWLDEDAGTSTPFLWVEHTDRTIKGTRYTN